MVQGGIFLRKMPLGIEDSVKTRIETAVTCACAIQVPEALPYANLNEL
jgi:hypothetical protein